MSTNIYQPKEKDGIRLDANEIAESKGTADFWNCIFYPRGRRPKALIFPVYGNRVGFVSLGLIQLFITLIIIAVRLLHFDSTASTVLVLVPLLVGIGTALFFLVNSVQKMNKRFALAIIILVISFFQLATYSEPDTTKDSFSSKFVLVLTACALLASLLIAAYMSSKITRWNGIAAKAVPDEPRHRRRATKKPSKIHFLKSASNDIALFQPKKMNIFITSIYVILTFIVLFLVIDLVVYVVEYGQNAIDSIMLFLHFLSALIVHWKIILLVLAAGCAKYVGDNFSFGKEH